MNLSIIIPVYNEGENIRQLIEEISTCMDGETDYEIVVVDDASSDDTSAALVECRTRYTQLRVLRHRDRCGQSTAIATGVNAAVAPWIVTLDGDGQNDPADISKLFRSMQEADDRIWLIAGYRKQRNDTLLKRFSSRLANAVRGFVLQDNTPDTGCGLKIFSRDTFLNLPRFDHMHRFLPALVQRQGGEILSVEVNHRPRLRGKSKYGVQNRLWAGIVDMLGVMWLQRRAKHPVVYEPE
ncbi:MAG: glycosyltransferase family 2 protein [Gammaproteobacteria bacterium]